MSYEEMKDIAQELAALPDKAQEKITILTELALMIQGNRGQEPPPAEKAS